jgi:hypothetical protein
MKALWSWAGSKWCNLMHPAPMWPVKGYYQCPACLRSYPVPWETRTRPVSAEMPGPATTERPAAMAAAASR